MSTTTEAPDQLPPAPSTPDQGVRTKPKNRQPEEGLGLFPRIHLTSGFLFPRPLGDNEVPPFGEMLPVEEQDVDTSLGDDGPKVVETPKYIYRAVVAQDKEGRNGEWWQRTQKTPPSGKKLIAIFFLPIFRFFSVSPRLSFADAQDAKELSLFLSRLFYLFRNRARIAVPHAFLGCSVRLREAALNAVE